DTPKIEVHLIDRKDLPSAGAGETGIVAVAPAVSNAVFAATGTRLRSMPMAAGGAYSTCAACLEPPQAARLALAHPGTPRLARLLLADSQWISRLFSHH